MGKELTPEEIKQMAKKAREHFDEDWASRNVSENLDDVQEDK